jgi:hypothetical protein
VSSALVILNRNYFADVLVGDCDTTHPYTIETGKNSVPGDFLLSIPSSESIKWLGEKPTSSYSVCSASRGRLPANVDSSGRIWFKLGADVPAFSKDVVYIEKDKQLIANPLFPDTQLASYPFDTVPGTSDSADGWKMTINNPTVKFDQSIISDPNPGDTSTLKLSVTDPGTRLTATTPNAVVPPDIELLSPELDVQPDMTNVLDGWLKTENLQIPGLNGNQTSLDGSPAISIGYQIAHTIPDALPDTFPPSIRNNIQGKVSTTDTDVYTVNNGDNIDWDEALSTYTDFDNSSIVNDKSTGYADVHCITNKARIRITISNVSGDIYLGNFKVIKDVPVVQSLKDPVASSTTNWAQSYFAHYGEISNNPQQRVILPGSSFTYSADTSFYYTNDFANYYADHTDGNQIVIGSPLNNVGAISAAYSGAIPFKPISEYATGKSIIIGDMANPDFSKFVTDTFPTVTTRGVFKPEGYVLYAQGDNIVVAGSDMAGSYYGVSRLAELLNKSSEISAQVEIDYPDLALRTWLYNYKNNGGITSNLDVRLADIKKAAAYRFNGYMVFSTTDFALLDSSDPADAAQLLSYQTLFALARKYFVEPIPEVITHSYIYKQTGTRQMPSGATIGRTYVQEPVTFKDRTDIVGGGRFYTQFGKLVERDYDDDSLTPADSTHLIPLLVQKADKSLTYTESTDGGVTGDYTIQVAKWVNGQTNTTTWEPTNEHDLAADSSATPPRDDYNAMYTILRTATSRIGVADTVVMTFNGVPKFVDSTTIDGKPLPPAAVRRVGIRLNSPEFATFTKKAIQNAITLFNPKYIHINNGETPTIGLDYRDLFKPDGTAKSDNSSAEILSNELNDMDAFTTAASNGQTRMISWSDNLNPFHKPGSNYLANTYPYPHAAIDTISKSIILDHWDYDSTETSCQDMSKFSSLALSKGLDMFLSPSMYNVEPEANWRCWAAVSKTILTAQSQGGGKLLGWITPDWSTMRLDASEAQLLSSIEWNLGGVTAETDARDHTPPVISEVNVTEGQIITSNPYVIRAKVTDDVAVDHVQFYADGELFGASALPDLQSNYEYPLDTSKYLGKAVAIKIVAYDTSGNTSEVTVNSSIGKQVQTQQDITGTPVFELPRTGRDND